MGVVGVWRLPLRARSVSASRAECRCAIGLIAGPDARLAGETRRVCDKVADPESLPPTSICPAFRGQFLQNSRPVTADVAPDVGAPRIGAHPVTRDDRPRVS